MGLNGLRAKNHISLFIVHVMSRPLLRLYVWRILVSSIPLVYDGNRFLRFLY
jgi:hypothetical protein